MLTYEQARRKVIEQAEQAKGPARNGYPKRLGTR